MANELKGILYLFYSVIYILITPRLLISLLIGSGLIWGGITLYKSNNEGIGMMLICYGVLVGFHMVFRVSIDYPDFLPFFTITLLFIMFICGVSMLYYNNSEEDKVKGSLLITIPIVVSIVISYFYYKNGKNSKNGINKKNKKKLRFNVPLY
jgi:preprotein translocase subunit SecG